MQIQDATQPTGLERLPEVWRLPTRLWEQVERLLPPEPSHPLNCHNPRVDDSEAMAAILVVLRSGCQWALVNMLDVDCSKAAAYRRFREWGEAGVFRRLGPHQRPREAFLAVEHEHLTGNVVRAPERAVGDELDIADRKSVV